MTNKQLFALAKRVVANVRVAMAEPDDATMREYWKLTRIVMELTEPDRAALFVAVKVVQGERRPQGKVEFEIVGDPKVLALIEWPITSAPNIYAQRSTDFDSDKKNAPARAGAKGLFCNDRI